MNSIPNMVSLPVASISSVRRIGEPAVKTVLAITKMRVCCEDVSRWICNHLRGIRAAVTVPEVARYRVLASFSRISISQAADCSTASRCATFSLR
jgi:hypothetical protein